MKFSDEGIIISQKKYGENSMIVKVFSRDHGICKGFVKSVKSSKSKVIFQIGNLISFEFRARSEESMGGFFAVDLLRSYCSKIMFDKLRIDCVSSLFSIIDSCFLEHENHEILFEKIQIFLQEIVDDKISKEVFLAKYVKLELKILKILGYEIDLSSCVVSGSEIDLAFVSPKSARAVSFEIGKPYQNKLLKLPQFLVQEEVACNDEHLLQGFDLSGFFLKKFLFAENNFFQNQQCFFHRGEMLKALKK